MPLLAAAAGETGQLLKGGYMSSITHPTGKINQQSTFGDRIEVIDLVRIDNQTATKAICRVRLGAIVISAVRVVVPVLSSHPFVAMPTRKDATGNWTPLVTFSSPTLEQAVNLAVLRAWRDHGSIGGALLRLPMITFWMCGGVSQG
jgi:DNA-binding cell septation regulator SpoVG